jgi:hypothetical protein
LIFLKTRDILNICFTNNDIKKKIIQNNIKFTNEITIQSPIARNSNVKNFLKAYRIANILSYFPNISKLNIDNDKRFDIVNKDKIDFFYSKQLNIIYRKNMLVNNLIDLSVPFNNDKDMRGLKMLTNLTNLNISCSRLTDTAFNNEINHLTNLKYLNLSHCYLLHHLTFEKFENLIYLNIAHCYGICISAYVAETLPNSLEQLIVNYSALVPDYHIHGFFENLSCYAKKLICLDIGVKHKLSVRSTLIQTKLSRNLTDDQISNILLLDNLEYLNISDCPFLTPAGFNQLTSLTRLTFLNVSRTYIDDDTLSNLSLHLLNLTDLNMSECPDITNFGLLSLSSLVNLSTLNITNCDQVVPDETILDNLITIKSITFY